MSSVKEKTKQGSEDISEIQNELLEGMALSKCRKCGCMKGALKNMQEVLSTAEGEHAIDVFKGNLKTWTEQMEPIKYACLGCAYCYPAVATNLLHKAFPNASVTEAAPCSFEVKEKIWPPVPGEYFVLGEGKNFPVAVSTLSSAELADKLSHIKPEGLCIAGKTETENIGIDKVIKNTVTNQHLRFLLLAGEDPKRHFSGRTLLALHKNGVDERMRVIGSPGAHPVLRNVTRDEVEIFRKQIKIVEMIGCADTERVAKKISELSRRPLSMERRGGECVCVSENAPALNVPVIQAEDVAKENVALDKAGYFVILPQAQKKVILVEHYSYDNTLLHIMEGKDARSIYHTLIKNGWVTELSHAAYLGKELVRAEASLNNGTRYVQDGA